MVSNVTANISRWAFDGLVYGKAYLHQLTHDLATLNVSGFHYTMSRDLYESIISGEFYVSFLTPSQAQLDYYCPSCDDREDIDLISIYERKLAEAVKKEDYETAHKLNEIIKSNTNNDG